MSGMKINYQKSEAFVVGAEFLISLILMFVCLLEPLEGVIFGSLTFSNLFLGVLVILLLTTLKFAELLSFDVVSTVFMSRSFV
jgi:hypothetical protein